MCGIVGTINKHFDNKVLDLIKHRGPDDSEILNLSIENNDITLGHRRLSIQDLSSAGHQPMYSVCGKFIIIFNGEIYNHLELRKKLGSIKFKGHSDTETIVNYLAKFGIESVKDFNGIFGFSLIDIENKKLFLVRDRYGIKPIYFYNEEDTLIYSSEIRPLKAIVDAGVDKENIGTLLKLRYNPAPTTLYDNIHKLRAGHILEYDLKTNSINTSSFIIPVMIDKNISFDDALIKYGELFEQAIKRQLLADVEVGILLSGGIDSALVAYFAQKYSDKPIKTFTIGFEEDDDSDEINDARESARILGTEHYEIKITDDQFEEVFKKCIEIVEEPLGTTSIIPMYFLNKLVSSYGMKVVLTGQGADEPLSGYKRYQGEELTNRVPSFVFTTLKPLSKFIKNESIFRAINSLGEKDIIKRFGMIYALFSKDEIKKLLNVEESKSYDLIKYFYELLDGKTKDSTNAMMSNDMRMNLCDDLLLYTDKISMHFSIEARVPMLDNDLIDFVESLPLEYKLKGKEGKYIHKKFAESVLPKEIIYRKKKGFKSPTEKWFKGDKGLMYKKMLVSEDSKFSDFFDIDEVGRIFDIHMSGKRNMEKQLFTLISLYYWMENL
jgi:asparagine synthase (glutamine-hydrolysing)